MGQFWSHVTPWMLEYKWLEWKHKYYDSNSFLNRHNNQQDMLVDSIARQQQQYTMAQFHKKTAPKAVQLAIKMGGIYVKMGQVIATVGVGLLQDDYIRALRPLQDGIPPRTLQEMGGIFEESTGRRLEDVFEWVEERPIGAASIGQAHKAVLKTQPSGTTETTIHDNNNDNVVIVKIQYPEVAELFHADLNNLEWATRLFMPGSLDMIRSVRERHAKELDFRLEAEHLRECARNLNRYDQIEPNLVRIPRVYNDSTAAGLCTQHVLVMEYLEGISMAEAVATEQDRMARALGHDNAEDMRAYFVQRIGEHLEETHANATLADDGAHDPAEYFWLGHDHNNNNKNPIGDRLRDWVQNLAMSPLGAGLFRTYVGLRERMDTMLAGSLANLLHKDARHNQSTKRKKRRQRPIALGRVLKTLIHVHGLQLLKDGVYNADPHPGNVLILPDGRLGLLDYGMVGRITDEQRKSIAKLIVALSRRDKETVTKIYREAGYRASWKEGDVLDDPNIVYRFATFHFDKFDMSPIHLSSPSSLSSSNKQGIHDSGNKERENDGVSRKDKNAAGESLSSGGAKEHHQSHLHLPGRHHHPHRTVKTMDLLKTTQEWAVPDFVEQGRRLTGLLSGVALQAGRPTSIAKEWWQIAEDVLRNEGMTPSSTILHAATKGQSSKGTKPDGKGWSLQSEIMPEKSGSGNSISYQRCGNHTTPDGRQLDLSSAREWLEYWGDQSHSPGAYTVLRADLLLSQPLAESEWKLWGLDFHMNRLEESLQYIHKSSRTRDSEKWKAESIQVMQTLLSETKEEILKALSIHGNQQKLLQNTPAVTAMVTILWQPQGESKQGGTSKTLQVRAHISSSLEPVQLASPSYLDPNPVRAVVALPTTCHDDQHAWPTRISSSPAAKLSSWCRQRRPLEETFKKQGVGEVLLVKKDESDNVELLEGLISNAFFVYKGGILRTAQSNVLNGYARHLVLQYAQNCGLKVDTKHPVTIQDSDQWDEVFITSSIRIIAPVNEILVPLYEKNANEHNVEKLETLWSFKPSRRKEQQFWRRLLEEILARGSNH